MVLNLEAGKIASLIRTRHVRYQKPLGLASSSISMSCFLSSLRLEGKPNTFSRPEIFDKLKVQAEKKKTAQDVDSDLFDWERLKRNKRRLSWPIRAFLTRAQQAVYATCSNWGQSLKIFESSKRCNRLNCNQFNSFDDLIALCSAQPANCV